MSGDLTRIEPPEKVISLDTMRWQPLGPGAAVVFSAQDETRARAMIADIQRDCLDGDGPFRQRLLELHRVSRALDLIRLLSKNFAGRGTVTVLEFVEVRRAWDALQASVLAEKIREAGDGQ
ncbi:hypothetical protein Geu3261_0025_017 [Komagataeibacter europaeus NBRC 3261]|uniref:Uncharacterized protein n=1 Tax=Komagataeibacter europaeus NBRC 3261 TaxID=1234669 RepID=A0A0D6PY71_KOMEU|nr:hypothetical protein [Komagataeibacter europaeus]GAN95461.1 hypothetical protein Geu3261_0025_017 [Komagataeibacter europaeus NBRC 3261]